MGRKSKQKPLSEASIQQMSQEPMAPYIQPLVREQGVKHILEEINDETPEDLPTIKSVGYAKLGSNWVSYVVTSKGREVLSIEVSDPDMRQIAEEQAKISFVELFVDKELA